MAASRSSSKSATQPLLAPFASEGGIAGAYQSWGRYPEAHHVAAYRPAWRDEIPAAIVAAEQRCLPYGLGRSYGDSCLNDGGVLIDCSGLDRVLAFDPNSGRIECEAGVSLDTLLQIVVPKGWFLPVTPGTKFVTLGGAIANDVHGKNHHRAGTIGRHVVSLSLYRSDRPPLRCVNDSNDSWFAATVGGLGLTGVIGTAEVQLKRIPGPWIDVETVPFQSLNAFMDLSEESDASFEYTVAWIDCLVKGVRGLFLRGNHGTAEAPPRSARRRAAIPFALPEFVLNRATIKAFNRAYYLMGRLKRAAACLEYDKFFYPLDAIGNWNLAYGRRGFLQWQCVVPIAAIDALGQALALIARSGEGSFLAVLKRFGDIRSPGMLSFPRPGFTLALDFPMRGARTLELLDRLDCLVREANGALYPAKDARMSSVTFRTSFPRLNEFRHYIDPKLSSSFWRRVTEQPD